MAAFSAESVNLEEVGPIIEVTIQVTASIAEVLRAEGKPVPSPVTALALIDTGASSSAVQAGLLAPLNLNPVSKVPVVTPTTTQSSMCELYAVRLGLPPGASIEVTVVAPPLVDQNIQALIGRDVLTHGVFIYEGHCGHFTLAL